MNTYRLNRRSLEKLKALVNAGKFNVEAAWSFTADDSNAMLGTANNWTDYAPWFLGLAEGKPDPAMDTGARPEKDWYAYPYGKGGQVYLSALEDIATDPNAARDIAEAAKACLDTARALIADRAKATACDLAVSFDAPVKIEASMTDSAGAPKGPPTFSMTAYTGGAMRLQGWKQPVVVDMAGMEDMHRSRPVLRDHDQGKIVGHTTVMACNDGKTLVACGVMSGHGPHRDEVVQAGLNDFPWQASIGARVFANQFVPDGQTAMANGQEWTGPINIARRTSLGEISFVALGADDNTSASIAAHAAGAATMKRKFSQWVEALGLIAASLSLDQYNGLLAKYKASEDFDAKDETAVDVKPPVKAAAKSDPPDGGVTNAVKDELQKELRAAAAAETKRIAAIRKLTDDFPDIQAKAIEEGWTAEHAELEVLRASRGPTGRNNVSHPFSINTGAGEQVTPDIVASAACISAGIGEKVALKGLTDQQKEIASHRKLRGMTIRGIMAMACACQGIPFHGVIDDTTIGKVIRAERDLDIHADGFATMTLTGITENILNKAMLEAYGQVPSVVEDICWQTDTNDFKTYKRYRLTASGDFSEVGEAGDLKSMSLQDESYPNQVKTQGMIMTVTRNILINDDMGALTQMPTIIGRKAAIAREKAVFTTLYSGLSTNAPNQSSYHFSSTLKTLLSGSTYALSITALNTAVKQMMEQKDANGDPIMIEPDRILVPPALKPTAENLFNGADLIVTGLASTAAKTVDPNYNQHRRKYRPIASPWMGAQSGVSGYTDSNWLLLTNPAGGLAVVQIGYLRGQRVPIIERGEAEFNTLGIAMRAYYDFGTALHDYRCGVWAAGA